MWLFRFLIWILIWQMQCMVYIGLSPCPVTVTTRIHIFFVRRSWPLLLGGGTTQGIYLLFSIFLQQQPSTSQPPQSPNGKPSWQNVTGLGRGDKVVLGDSGTLKWRAFLIAIGGFLESLEETVPSLRDFDQNSSVSNRDILDILGKQGLKKGWNYVVHVQVDSFLS